ncbi:MAG TPA: hypothetical protein VJT81_06805 [Burkholderiales bacterium]|nr:hypothetical protein [Burkholderiales bacterium]
MTERPILFSGEMVRAILEDRKTQTRRVVKPQPAREAVKAVCVNDWWMWERWAPDRRHFDGKMSELQSDKLCPYGVPGDQLWVREAWRTLPDADSIAPRNLMNVEAYTHYEADGNHDGMGKLRPGMFMPRWASRITLEVTEIRVERIQEISDDDILCEGIDPSDNGDPAIERSFNRIAFSTLWDNLNARRGFPWDDDEPPPGWKNSEPFFANPWVWAISFKQVWPDCAPV